MRYVRARPRLWVAAVAPLASPAHAQVLATGSSPEVSVIRIVAVLVICLATVFAVAIALRGRQTSQASFGTRMRALGFASGSRIEVIEARRVSQHADVCMVRVDGREYVVVAGAAGLELLALPAPDALGTSARVQP